MDDELYISEIILNNFRNYSSKRIVFSSSFNVIVGNNGAGKTNILEAISLFSNSKGLRSAAIDELVNIRRDCPFLPSDILYSLMLNFSNKDKILILQKNDCKIIKINNEIIKKSSALNKYLNITYLVPQMDDFFIGASSVRRKFIDKTAELLFIDHYDNVKKYDFFLKERMKILTTQTFNDKWLYIVEKKIAELGVNIASIRLETINILNNIFVNFTKNFPTGKIDIIGDIENKLKNEKSIEVEGFFADILKNNRTEDCKNKRTSVGIHKSDIFVFNNEKNMVANLCSTGEQKILLISLIFVRCIFSKQYCKGLPILLLDEVCSHLDNETKEKLFYELKNILIQTFLTGINEKDFIYLTENFIKL